MGDLTIASLCQVLANLTHNRCSLVENSNTCRCVEEAIGAKPSVVVSAAPDVMLSEVILIFFVLGLWLSAIGFCLHQYKSLRRLETQVHYCVNRKDPLNIGDIKIVAREQDSIIYKKKRYSTVLDTQINVNDLKQYQYVKQYLPKNTPEQSSALSALVVHRDELTSNVPLSTAPILLNRQLSVPSGPHSSLTTHEELLEDQSSSQIRTTRTPPLVSFLSFEDGSPVIAHDHHSYVRRTGSARSSTGLTVPHISSPNSLHSSWNSSQMCEGSCSAQHLSVPDDGLRLNRYSDENISFGHPSMFGHSTDSTNEELIDPRLIPNTVRRSLLALHRASHENIHTQLNRTKEKTQSENDVHGAFTPWKIKMKSKLKRTHHQPEEQPPETPVKSRTPLLPPKRYHSKDHERRASEYAIKNTEQRFSTPPLRNTTTLPNSAFRRSLKHYPKYSTQSITESEIASNDVPKITSVLVSTDDDDSESTIIAKDQQASLLTTEF